MVTWVFIHFVLLVVVGIACALPTIPLTADSSLLAGRSISKPAVARFPLIANTWPFVQATSSGWTALSGGGSAIDGVVAAGSECEQLQCDGSVGYGGSPDEDGETSLDAMVMDGTTRDVGAVGYLRRVKNAIQVARRVLEATSETLIVGDGATKFAIEMGFPEESLTTNTSRQIYEDWLHANCTPNYWNPPYTSPACRPTANPIRAGSPLSNRPGSTGSFHHDTIGIVTVDAHGNFACGTSTNGASHKIPGRVGDAPIAGAGSYCETGAGGAAATGDGDIMMRFLPTFSAVQFMKAGMSPGDACSLALKPILQFYPHASAGLVCVNAQGDHGGARAGFSWFSYSYQDASVQTPQVVPVS